MKNTITYSFYQVSELLKTFALSSSISPKPEVCLILQPRNKNHLLPYRNLYLLSSPRIPYLPFLQLPQFKSSKPLNRHLYCSPKIKTKIPKNLLSLLRNSLVSFFLYPLFETKKRRFITYS